MITYDYYDIWNVPGCAVSHLLVSPRASSFESVSNEISIDSIETYWDHTGLLSTAFLVAATASCHISHTKRRIKSIQIVQATTILAVAAVDVILVWISSKVKSGCQCPYRYGGTLVPSLTKQDRGTKLEPWPDLITATECLQPFTGMPSQQGN